MEQLRQYLLDNYIFLREYFSEHLPQIKILPLEATYLVWIDVSALQQPSENIAKKILVEKNVWLNEGTIYGSAGEGFLRINIACPRQLLEKGLSKIKDTLGNSI